jgi:hypothetical protein
MTSAGRPEPKLYAYVSRPATGLGNPRACRCRLAEGPRGADPGARTSVWLGSSLRRGGGRTIAPLSVRIRGGAGGTLAGRNHGTSAPPGAPGSPRAPVERMRVRERACGSVPDRDGAWQPSRLYLCFLFPSFKKVTRITIKLFGGY